MRFFIMAGALIALSGCVTPGDLLEIRTANQEATAKIQAEVSQYQSGQKSLEDAQAAIAAARLEGDQRIEASISKAVERTEQALELARSVKDGSLSIAEGLGGSAGIAGLIGLALNAYRNNTRRRELELQSLKQKAGVPS